MSLHIIIDGYNLIRQSGFFSAFDNQDIQIGRETLVETLAAYKRIKGHKITVVFDGANAPLFSQARDRIKGIKVRFSRSGESADNVIKSMAAKEREKALIVSSDVDVVHWASSKGCATISSPEFEDKIFMAVHMDSKGIDQEDNGGWIPTTKKKGPSRRFPKKKRRSRAKIQKL
jgi:predicted RNA-binding protein with PIN domain